jgi:hypothetical protein
LSPFSLSVGLRLTTAGRERARLAKERGEDSVLGTSLPLRSLDVEEKGRHRTYWIGPVREGGPDERLAWFEIASRG